MAIVTVPSAGHEWDELSRAREGKGPEIHSAKAHRCVDKVKAKGHDESSAWAICTTSIGKEGVYARGHGGSARPKRKVREHGDPSRSGPYPHGGGQAVADHLPSYKKDLRRQATSLADNRRAPLAPDTFRDSSLSDLARVIRKDWKKVNYAAKPYLDALSQLDKITDTYGADSAESVVAYFLGNATSWRGPVAKVVKAELKRRLGRK